MENSYSFRSSAYWILARRGIVSAEAVPQSIEFSAPPEFGGETEMWTPETFFLAGVATDPKLNQGDGLHPTAAGVDVIVARILPSVEALIARARAERH